LIKDLPRLDVKATGGAEVQLIKYCSIGDEIDQMHAQQCEVEQNDNKNIPM